MGRKANHSRSMATKFQTNLLAGLLTYRRLENHTPLNKELLREAEKTVTATVTVQAPPNTKYTNAKGAAQYLGLSKATFFRLRAKGHFQPSPVTGLYHLDDLDRESRAVPAALSENNSAEAATQKTFGNSETHTPLAHGGSVLKPVSLE